MLAHWLLGDPVGCLHSRVQYFQVFSLKAAVEHTVGRLYDNTNLEVIGSGYSPKNLCEAGVVKACWKMGVALPTPLSFSFFHVRKGKGRGAP